MLGDDMQRTPKKLLTHLSMQALARYSGMYFLVRAVPMLVRAALGAFLAVLGPELGVIWFIRGPGFMLNPGCLFHSVQA